MSNQLSTCCVKGCPNSMISKVESAVFYFVPKERARSKKWALALKDHKDKTSSLLEALICLEHFKLEDFEADSFTLKKAAVPSIFPSSGDESDRSEEPPRKKTRLKKRALKNKKTETNVDKNNAKKSRSKQKKSKAPGPVVSSKGRTRRSKAKSPKAKKETDEEEKYNEDSSGSDIFSLRLSESSKDSVAESVEEQLHFKEETTASDAVEREYLIEEIKRLKETKESLLKEQEDLLAEECLLNEELASLDAEIKKQKKHRNFLPEEELGILKKCFSPAQIRHLVGSCKAKWSLDDLAMAYTISSLTSRDVYVYLRNELKFPLPSVSNVNRCYRNMDFRRKNDSKIYSFDDDDENDE